MKSRYLIAMGTALTGIAVAATVQLQQSGAAPTATDPASRQTGLAPTTTLKAAPTAQAAAVPPSDTYGLIGTVTSRSAAQLAAAGITSPFSIGGETTDRNFSTYANWASYLGPLGFPAARVQTGWADVEKTRTNPATYSFTKLDGIVAGMKGQSVQPWFDLIYGNTLYTGGGTPGLGAKIPTAGSEGMTAWLAFVTATVTHFDQASNRVTEWQIWNEPDGGGNDPAAFATFAAATAKAIKAAQPGAKILLAGFANALGNFSYAQTVVNNFAAEKGSTVPSGDVWVTYHPYSANPDDSYGTAYDNLKSLADSKGFHLRQGENGAPSVNQPDFALKNLPWTEDGQAKYALRRLLGDFRRGIPSNLFTITDLHYTNAKNTKGLLRTGTWSASPPTYGDQTVQGKKTAYRAVQALTAVFDDRLELLTNQGCTLPAGYTIHAYSRLDTGNIRRNMLVIWRSSAPAYSAQTPEDITVTCTVFNFPRYKSMPNLRPRYTDLLTGQVYQLLKASTVSQPGSTGVTITGLRVYDSPIVLADQGIVPVS